MEILMCLLLEIHTHRKHFQGYYDAGIGNYLQGDGSGNFKSIPVAKSGFFVNGDAKGLSRLMLGNGKQLFLVTQNRDSLKVFSPV